MLKRLILQNYRNFTYSQYFFDHPLVLIHGDNGTGKTNILEAISLLSTSKGLRGATVADLGFYDGHQHQNWTLFFDLSGHTVAIQSTDGKKSVRLNNKAAHQKDLLEVIRVFWVSPENDRLFTDTPSQRRQFINQFMEIIHPTYTEKYKQYMHFVQERSQILRTPTPPDAGWLTTLEGKIADLALEIYQQRAKFLDTLNQWIGQLIHFSGHRFKIADTWYDNLHNLESDLQDHTSRFQDNLYQNRTYDQIHGGCRIGPHKSDLVGYRADMPLHLCSNGQQCVGLMSILLGLIKQYSQQQPVIFLIDEIFSHLDAQHQQLLLEEIQAIPHLQTFLTLPHAREIDKAQVMTL